MSNGHWAIDGEWPHGRGVRGEPFDYQAAIDELDAISRTRALTEAESILLERMIWRVDKKTNRRAGYGENKVLARVGIGRTSVGSR